VFGAAADTGNLGVSALGRSTAFALSVRSPALVVALADFGRGVSDVRSSGGAPAIMRFGFSPGQRFHRPENMRRIEVECGLGLALSPTSRLLRDAAAFLDISGGDSFTDLYGPRRFGAICAPKRLALRLRKPLILLPQTYGPFRESGNRDEASRLVRTAAQAWARDARSFEILRDLLGGSFDPCRHRPGVDVAFLLPATDPGVLAADARPGEVGINVSGLIWNDPRAARERYGFKAEYREAMTRVVGSIAAEAPVVLVPHVVTPRGHYESDRDACEALAARLPAGVRGAVRVCPDPSDPCRVKGLIARCGWFLGTRMHATIAGLSSGVPTAAVSYSDKTLGVFETCGQGGRVHDPRRLSTDELTEAVLASFRGREAARASLAAALPGVKARAEEQMDEVAAVIRGVTNAGGAALRR
jgi:polysaccharide pyruvyl transferase WcaK-like protein